MDMAAASYFQLQPSSWLSYSLRTRMRLKPSSSLSPSRNCCFRCSYSFHHHRSLSPTANNTLTNIQNSGVIACLRAPNSELAMEAARAAISGGISVLEIVVSTPGVFEIIQQLGKDFPATTLGVGTVLTTKDAKNAINAGAKFLMSPATVKDILNDVRGSETLYIPGAMTPTEIMTAYNAGAEIVKVYPVSAMGGARYIAALRKPFPHIQMVASQGITIDLIGEYIGNGSSSIVLSDAIFDKDSMAQRNFSAISQLAHNAALQGNLAVKRFGDGFYCKVWERDCALDLDTDFILRARMRVTFSLM